MVDAFVSYAVQKLGDFLLQEVSLRKSLRQEVMWLRKELLFMQSFLKDAEQKQVEDHTVQQWVFEINEVANDSVAILETYSLEAGEGDSDGLASLLKAGEGNGDGLASRLKACACICRKETKFYNISKEIQSLKQRIMDISRKRETYGIRDINNVGEGPNNYRPNNQRSVLRRTTSYMDKQDQIFVGFKDVVERLLAELVKAEPRRTVISIYGMGGLGKTTLAKNLYHSPSITNIFDVRAWVCVSQQYNTMNLLRNTIKSIQGCDRETLDLLEKMTDITDLEKYLRNLLKKKKYLVVIDDVWQREAWQSLERALPDSNNESRVIITTRNADVAKRADENGLPHNLRFLTEEESWDLFCRKLLDVEAMIPAMETLARDMVSKCRGLPLAIAALSGLLSHKRGLEEWERVKEHLWNRVKNDFIAISDILSLSYNDLPTVLKHCFLYFGIFPEDRQIDAKNLMWLWIADGLIPRGEERIEDVAQDFLNELIRRSLVQVVETFWEEVVTCGIHDLLRDLAIQKASAVNFLDVYGPRENSISSSCRRHTIHDQGERYLTLDFSKLNLRSVTFFDQRGLKLDRIKFRNMFQHLYVLYLENDSVRFTLPDSIGSLYNLRYLSFTGSCDIPSSIGNLKNLLTFQASGADFYRLPPEIANLVNLRHLVVRYKEPLQHINKLTSLQVLRYIYCNQWKDVNPIDLTNLRELNMVDIKKYYSLNNISSLKSLSTLHLLCEYGELFPALEFLSSCQKLQKLRLNGRIGKLPPFPNSITMMILSRSYLMEDPMPILGMLPNLRNLELRRAAYEGKEITCSDNSFSQLEFLSLTDLQKLERWDLATSAMPLIKGLRIHCCPELNEIPERLKDMERRSN